MVLLLLLLLYYFYTSCGVVWYTLLCYVRISLLASCDTRSRRGFIRYKRNDFQTTRRPDRLPHRPFMSIALVVINPRWVRVIFTPADVSETHGDGGLDKLFLFFPLLYPEISRHRDISTSSMARLWKQYNRLRNVSGW